VLIVCSILYSHGGEYEKLHFLGYNGLQFSESHPTLEEYIAYTFKTEQQDKQETSMKGTSLQLIKNRFRTKLVSIP
jgi:hypothetical protein